MAKGRVRGGFLYARTRLRYSNLSRLINGFKKKKKPQTCPVGPHPIIIGLKSQTQITNTQISYLWFSGPKSQTQTHKSQTQISDWWFSLLKSQTQTQIITQTQTQKSQTQISDLSFSLSKSQPQIQTQTHTIEMTEPRKKKKKKMENEVERGREVVKGYLSEAMRGVA